MAQLGVLSGSVARDTAFLASVSQAPAPGARAAAHPLRVTCSLQQSRQQQQQQHQQQQHQQQHQQEAQAQAQLRRRDMVQGAGAGVMGALLAFGFQDEAHAMLANRRAFREKQVKDEDFTTLDNGLKVYDIKIGGGKKVEIGDRVTVHYIVKWKGVTFMTSRQGGGVTGGTPYGFDVGSSDRGYVLKGLDLGVQGMRVGGQREIRVPPELAYGSKGLQEIPPNATLDLNIEVLSVKESPFGYQVKLVEG